MAINRDGDEFYLMFSVLQEIHLSMRALGQDCGSGKPRCDFQSSRVGEETGLGGYCRTG